MVIDIDTFGVFLKYFMVLVNFFFFGKHSY